MTNCMHFIHPPKIIQIWWGRHVNFVSGKNRPLLLTKSVHWCFIHVYSAFMARNLGYFAKKVDDIPPTLTTNNLFGLTWFLCIRYKHTKYVDHFFILEIQFFCWEKNTKLETSPTRRHVMNCQLYKFVIVIDWSMKCDFFICRVPSCFKLWAYWFIHCIDDRPTIVYCLDCVKLLQYPCIFHYIL